MGAGKLYANVVPAGTRTASGAAAALPADFTDETELIALVKVTAVSGTTPSMNVRIQDSIDGGATWATVQASSAITGVSTQAVRVPRGSTFGPLLRISWDSFSGTSPSFTFSVDLWAAEK